MISIDGYFSTDGGDATNTEVFVITVTDVIGKKGLPLYFQKDVGYQTAAYMVAYAKRHNYGGGVEIYDHETKTFIPAKKFL